MVTRNITHSNKRKSESTYDGNINRKTQPHWLPYGYAQTFPESTTPSTKKNYNPQVHLFA